MFASLFVFFLKNKWARSYNDTILPNKLDNISKTNKKRVWYDSYKITSKVDFAKMILSTQIK